ncbi:hypothetical protein VTK26DRAFT_6583 [Humicola hyalothermophila]
MMPLVIKRPSIFFAVVLGFVLLHSSLQIAPLFEDSWPHGEIKKYTSDYRIRNSSAQLGRRTKPLSNALGLAKGVKAWAIWLHVLRQQHAKRTNFNQGRVGNRQLSPSRHIDADDLIPEIHNQVVSFGPASDEIRQCNVNVPSRRASPERWRQTDLTALQISRRHEHQTSSEHRDRPTTLRWLLGLHRCRINIEAVATITVIIAYRP